MLRIKKTRLPGVALPLVGVIIACIVVFRGECGEHSIKATDPNKAEGKPAAPEGKKSPRSQHAGVPKRKKPGLVGARFGEPDLTRLKNTELLGTLEHLWLEQDDRGHAWSAKWQGVLVAPASGPITFHVETNKRVIFQVDGKQILIPGPVDRCRVFEFLRFQSGHMERSGSVTMKKGKEYPITVTYFQEDGFYGYLRVKWSWRGQEKTFIPAENLRHSVAQERAAGWAPPQSVDRSAFVTVPVRHVLVYGEPGRFAGWPANDGLWNWGDEILVGFNAGYFMSSKYGHSLNRSKPRQNLLARSLDGGRTWKIEDPESFAGDGEKPQPCPGNIDFAHPDFAMHCRGAEFRVSRDRGKTWQGPYKLPDIGKDLSARTDYVVNGAKECLFFLSAQEKRVKAAFQDRAFCARTTDGGKTIKFLSWMMSEPASARSVMPSTVRCAERHLVSAIRRRLDVRVEDGVDYKKNWIDVHQSTDDGNNWEFLSKVADTEKGERNGNPPSMVRLKDGRLCVTYGYRSTPYGIRAKLSSDNGRTWGEEIHLRDDGRTWDLGYPRTFQRMDGQLVTIYYFTTTENPEQHIAATIWDPSKVK